ncbi:RecQ family ATP-dependent DNA helicase [Halosimplex salinum]|uniref:RecQ family ATP-dependent DNA helicase n=1 Tax=Halosimplex salinum TaxID=1710538 RepID=UPI0019D0D7FF|nr:RecQ family ATP-dependent DNA helicase [Halosimplex salinum]
MNSSSGRASEAEAQRLLERSIGPDAEFRPQQWEAIDGLVNEKERLLLVQRTGWGKSTVYFIATKLLRERGEGPTLIVSPLLALMHNQIQDAEQQLGLEARTIHSNNTEEWEAAKRSVVDGTCDVLLVSPERLANQEFQEDVLVAMQEEFGLLVVDEAHCISNWGHDFRPDYRRIKRILRELPEHIPVAATTATANDRVVEDVTRQVPDLRVVRGDLVRESLRIQTIEMDSRADRLAWLAETLPDLPSAGIVYCLTTDEVEIVADWLTQHGLSVEPYHGGVDGDRRRRLEARLLANDVDALVATNALGMGFNKPDLGWVVHFQRPPNLIRYYQEIGRAGRGLDEAFAVLLSGEEDDDIAEFFIEQAFPDPADFELVLQTVAESDEPLYKYEILKRANVSWKAASKCLDILRVENALIRVDDGFERTGKEWTFDHDRIESITEHRWEELAQIQAFVETDACLTKFIDDVLDGSMDGPCGRCANCAGEFVPTSVRDERLVRAATDHYRAESWSEISARYYMPERGGGRSKIDESRKPEEGRSLCVYGDPGLGTLVSGQRDSGDPYSDQVVDAAVEHVQEVWEPTPEPTWVAAVPSTSAETDRVADLAERIAQGLGLPYEDALRKVGSTAPDGELKNSYQKRWDVEGVFEATKWVRPGPVLLVDDTVDTRWTLTEAGMTLRDGGSGDVYPLALAERTGW